VNTLKRICVVLPLVLLVLTSANAGAVPAKVYFSGGYAFADNGYGIPPYQGTLNGQKELFYCVDFAHEITGNTSWEAYVLGLGSPASAFGSTRLDDRTTYLEMAWLISQMGATSNQTELAQLQWAVWSFTGAHSPYFEGNVITQALFEVNHGLFAGNGWEILTPTGNYGQEFLVADSDPIATPEPASLLLFGTGLLGIAFITRKQLAH